MNTELISKITPQYIIDREGKKTAIIIDIDVFEKLMEEIEDFYFGKLAEATLEDDQEEYSLDEVEKDLKNSE